MISVWVVEALVGVIKAFKAGQGVFSDSVQGWALVNQFAILEHWHEQFLGGKVAGIFLEYMSEHGMIYPECPAAGQVFLL